MGYPEFLSWVSYRNRYGTLHQGMRIDRAIGRFMAFWGNSKSKNGGFTYADFSPYDKPKEPEQGDIHQAFALLQFAARSKKG